MMKMEKYILKENMKKKDIIVKNIGWDMFIKTQK